MRHCKHCGEPEKTKGEDPKGGDFGWFDASEGLICLNCGKPNPQRNVPKRGQKKNRIVPK